MLYTIFPYTFSDPRLFPKKMTPHQSLVQVCSFIEMTTVYCVCVCVCVCEREREREREREQVHSLTVFSSVGITGEPEPMGEKELREASYAIDVFGEPLVCFY